RLQLLADILEGADPPDFANYSSPDILLFARLLQGLRAELLSAEAATEEDPRELLGLLVAIEATYERVQRGAPHSSFLRTWTALRGPELRVELARDLRSPLPSSLFLAETLRSRQSGPLTDLQHQQLGIIHSAALTVVAMAGHVIELARGDDVLIEKEP